MDSKLQHTLANYFAKQPVDKAWLFGSYSRGEETQQSDVDILVSFVPGSNVTLLQYAHIMSELQKLLGKKVDLVEEGELMDFAAASAQHDKVLIYEREAKRQ